MHSQGCTQPICIADWTAGKPCSPQQPRTVSAPVLLHLPPPPRLELACPLIPRPSHTHTNTHTNTTNAITQQNQRRQLLQDKSIERQATIQAVKAQANQADEDEAAAKALVGTK